MAYHLPLKRPRSDYGIVSGEVDKDSGDNPVLGIREEEIIMTEAFPIPQEARDRRVDPIEAAFLTAIYNSMLVIRKRQQLKGLEGQNSNIKPNDGSFLTPTDLTSEQLAQMVFAKMLPGTEFSGEEGARTKGRGGRRIGYDPLDGTRPFVVGSPTSTVIGSIYNPDGCVYGAMIGEPVTGRVFSAFGGQQTRGRLLDFASGETHVLREGIRTWNGTLGDKGQVFLDNNQPYGRAGHRTLLGEQHDQLRSKLRKAGIGTMDSGSNGAHQLYVASGGDRAAGAITTARGVPEDTSAGAFLVERSGGAVQRLSAVEGVIAPVGRESPDYDMLVAANNERTLAILCEMLGGISASL